MPALKPSEAGGGGGAGWAHAPRVRVMAPISSAARVVRADGRGAGDGFVGEDSEDSEDGEDDEEIYGWIT